jgi:osmotically inducible protein OsmC
MALAAGLEGAGTPATRVHTDAACTVEKVEDGFKITSIKLKVTAQVPGVDDATFQKAAHDTKKNCVVSKALSAVDIQLEATLES